MQNTHEMQHWCTELLCSCNALSIMVMSSFWYNNIVCQHCHCRTRNCQFCLRDNSDVQRLVSYQRDVTAAVDDVTVTGVKPACAVCVVEWCPGAWHVWCVQLRCVSWRFITQRQSHQALVVTAADTQHRALCTTRVRHDALSLSHSSTGDGPP